MISDCMLNPFKDTGNLYMCNSTLRDEKCNMSEHGVDHPFGLIIMTVQSVDNN